MREYEFRLLPSRISSESYPLSRTEQVVKDVKIAAEVVKVIQIFLYYFFAMDIRAFHNKGQHPFLDEGGKGEVPADCHRPPG